MKIDSSYYNQICPGRLFKNSEVELFNNDLNHYINNLPENEEKKYQAFLKNDCFKLVCLEAFQADIQKNQPKEEFQEEFLYSFRFDVPDPCFMEFNSPKLDFYKTLVDTNLYKHDYPGNYFSNTRKILIENYSSIYRAIFFIYKKNAIVVPHAHLDCSAENQKNLFLNHTLLSDISGGSFNMWYSYNYTSLKKKGECFEFNPREAHFAEATNDSAFICVFHKKH